MCFSATASFTASAALSAIGILTLRKTTTHKEYVLASIPFIFALQQAIEGWIWLSLLHGGNETTRFWLTQLFVSFAGIVWPTAVPLGLYLIEREEGRKRIMTLIVGLGALIALYTLYMMSIAGANAQILNRCIYYSHPVEQTNYVLLAYIIATCSAFFISSERSLMWLGVVNLAAFYISYELFRGNLVSVWCFFAAIVSGLIYSYFNHVHHRAPRWRRSFAYWIISGRKD